MQCKALAKQTFNQQTQLAHFCLYLLDGKAPLSKCKRESHKKFAVMAMDKLMLMRTQRTRHLRKK